MTGEVHHHHSRGLGFLSALFLLFLGLKLTDSVSWSWWWVTCPLWLLPAVFLFLILVCLFFSRAFHD